MPEVLLRLSPVLLDAQVVDEGRAAVVDEVVEQVHEEVLDEERHEHADRLQQVVDQVELHGDHVPLLPPPLGNLAQPHHSLILVVLEPSKYKQIT